MMVDEKGLEVLRKGLPFHERDHLGNIQDWSAISVYEGPEAISAAGYVRALSRPLMKEGIDMMYYSTFTHDLILVDNEEYDRAQRCLLSRIHSSSVRDFVSSSSLSPSSSPSPSQSPRREKEGEREGGKTRGGYGERDHSMILTPFPSPLSIVTFLSRDLPLFASPLVDLFINADEREGKFFSFTRLEDEISLVIDHSLFMSLFPSGEEEGRMTRHPKMWRCVQIDVGAGGFTPGLPLVGMISDILGSNGVTIYYLSTFENDFVLVPQDQTSTAIDLLVQSLGASIADEP
eukprot:TRINITY_DN2230_c0_g1_i2.p1 TRINITY_DN2230_c0_g1~~TRINITY_DN2230_c0_g1_i2.p1  ORF type:complete len:290 (+),score=102.78 TRINITY_DN2230_c0_g1_i2:106-975(+)